MFVLCAAMFLMSSNANAALTIDVTFLDSPVKGDLRAKGNYTDTGYTYEEIKIYSALADGSVRTLGPGMSNRTFWLAVHIDDGQPLGSDW
jgi:hypothetical protein